MTELDKMIKLIDNFTGFMTPYVYKLDDKNTAIQCETNSGETHFMFFEDFADFKKENEIEVGPFNINKGFLCRLSASGFMDCTDWAVFETIEQVIGWIEENDSNEEIS